MCGYWKRQISPKALLPTEKLHDVRLESGLTRFFRNVDLHLFGYKFENEKCMQYVPAKHGLPAIKLHVLR